MIRMTRRKIKFLPASVFVPPVISRLQKINLVVNCSDNQHSIKQFPPPVIADDKTYAKYHELHNQLDRVEDCKKKFDDVESQSARII